MLHLVCVPAGCTAAEVFFAKAIQQGFSKAMLVTSSRTLVQRARQNGVNAVNFDYLANAVLRQCGRTKVQKISRKAQKLIVRTILDRLLQNGKINYFASLADKKGFLRSMTALMDQIGSCGVTEAEIASAFAHWDGRSDAYRQKDLEIAVIYREYLAYLIAHDVYDVQGLYRLAAEELSVLEKNAGSLKWSSLYFMGFYQFDTLQLAIIRMLSRFTDAWVALPYEAQRPDLYGATEFTYGDLMGYAVPEFLTLPATAKRAAPLQHILLGLRNPEAKPVPAGSGIEIWETADKTEELRAVLREIKQLVRQGLVRADEIAVVVRRLEDYRGIRALCDAYGIPVQMPDGAHLAANPLFRCLTMLLEMIPLHGREKAEACINFFSQPLLRIILGLRTEDAVKLAAQRYYTDYAVFLRDLAKLSGSETLTLLWQELEQFAGEATAADYCERLLHILTLTNLPSVAGRLYRDREITLPEFKNLVCAHAEILSLLRELPQDYRVGGYETGKIACTEFAEALAEAAGTVLLPLRPENMEGIAVLPAVNLEEASYQQVYVLGLCEKEFPFLKNENWIYNDRERKDLASLGIALPCAADGYSEDIHFFANACAAARSRLVLTYSKEDDRNVSPYIHEILSLFTDLRVQVKPRIQKLEDSLSREELELALVRSGQEGALRAVVDTELTEAGAGDWKRRENEQLWNGLLSDPSLVRQLNQRIGNRFSASKLESYRNCPFQFLAVYGWQQQVTEAAEEDLNPMQRGNLLHIVLERFISRHIGEGFTAAQWDALREELDAVFAGACREMEESGNLYAGEFWNYDREQLRTVLYRWLRNEIAYSESGNIRPAYTEKEFGRHNAEEFPVTVGQEQIFLNGIIDRIDKAGDAYYITDYKSGDVPAQKAFLDTDLQLPLYILAAEKLAAEEGGTVIGGGYYGLKDGERKSNFRFAAQPGDMAELSWKTYSEVTDASGTKVKIPNTDDLRKRAETILSALLQRMRSGDFVPTPTDGCDAYCPAAKICRFRVLSPDCDEEDING